MTQLTKPQLVREATLTEADLEQVRQQRRDYNRLGFAYQVAFVRLFNRFPQQVPPRALTGLMTQAAKRCGASWA